MRMHATKRLHFLHCLNGAAAFRHHCILHLYSCGRVMHYSVSSIRKALYLQHFRQPKIVWVSLSSFLFSLGAVIQLGTVTILRFIQLSHTVQLRHQQESETVHQTTKDKHLLFYTPAYVYKFMEHLMKKILPIMNPQVCQATWYILC